MDNNTEDKKHLCRYAKEKTPADHQSFDLFEMQESVDTQIRFNLYFGGQRPKISIRRFFYSRKYDKWIPKKGQGITIAIYTFGDFLKGCIIARRKAKEIAE